MTQPDRALVFAPREHGFIPWTLLGFILLSALVHAFGFFLFQTIYPAASRMNPPPPQVSLLAPGTPESDALLRWINSEDPALAAEPTRAAPSPSLTDLPYVPSYQSPHAKPTMSPPQEAPLLWPDGINSVDLMKMTAPANAAPAATTEPAATQLNFSAPLQTSGAIPAFDALHESTEATALQPARFLLGISDDGEVRYVFVQESSGDKDLDTDAAALLQQVKFQHAQEPLTWGFATFYWGSGVFAPGSQTGGTP
jgi:hypothetical protein